MKTVTTGTGFQDPLGNLVLSGNLVLTLSQAAEVTSGGGLIAPKVVVLALSATTAKIASTQIYFNDELTPTGTTYHAELLDSGGNIIADFGQWSITGASADLSTMVPVTSATVSLPGVVLTAPAAAQHISGAFDLTVPSLNGAIVVDGTQYARTDAGINSAIAAAPEGGTVYMSAGTYTITGQINITKRLKLIGAGWGNGTRLQVAASVGATTDVIQIKPTAAYIGTDMLGVRLQDFEIIAASGTPARSAIMIDGTSASVANLVIDHVRCGPLGNYSFNIQNASGLTNGTPYLATIRDSVFDGGMNFTNAGDSILVLNNQIRGTATTSPSSQNNVLISVIGAATTDQGAHGFQLIANNMVQAGGTIWQNATQGVMAYNNIEMPNATTEANSALVDVQGNASANIQNLKIYGNYLGATTGNVTDTIRIDKATATEIVNNYTVRSTGVAYRITANASKTHIVHDRLAPDTTINNFLADLGSNTLVEYADSGTAFKVMATNNGLALATPAGTVGIALTNNQLRVNPTNGAMGFTSGLPASTALDTAAWRGAANQWVFGNAFGDTSGALLYTQNGQVEAAAPSGVAGRTITWADSTAHRLKMNNNNTTAAMIVGVDGSTSQKAETAADTNVLTFTPPALAGTYRINLALSLSAANTATLGWTATWTDSNGNAQAPTNLSLFQEGTAAPALTFTTSAAGNYYGSAVVDVNNAAVAIVVKLTFTGTSFTGKASATVERLI